jgi:chaperone required for assembly of F1-ATPase
MKRFYEKVELGETEGGWAVLLDGKPMRTPAHSLLRLPTRAVAELVAGEWRAQGETLAMADMRQTRLATTVVDLMPARRGDAVEEAAGFAQTELLCYRAASPGELAERQDRLWQPWLDWAERQFDARLRVTRSIDPVAQPQPSLRALHGAIDLLDDWRLVGLHALATGMGSLVLALAVERGVLSAQTAWQAALLEELYQIEQWGLEEEQALRHERLRADLVAAGLYLGALGA